jgi:hypothetical protein
MPVQTLPDFRRIQARRKLIPSTITVKHAMEYHCGPAP